MSPSASNLWYLLDNLVGYRRTESLFAAVAIPEALLGPRSPQVARGQLAMAMNLLLFEDLLQRVPAAQAYLGDRLQAGARVQFDHGALRTVLAPCGELPQGVAAFTRILEPLGYREADLYPLERLAMTGHAWVHRDLPEALPQFFLSAFHPERFGLAFQAAVARTLGSSRDPLPPWCHDLLAGLQREGALALEQALRLLPNLVACFARQHQAPLLEDYRLLQAESDEMAWIATEGNAFNHVTDRVADVAALALDQQALGRPMKDLVEVSRSGRVLQTAYRAAQVERVFRTAQGTRVLVTVPGSFFEFITRKPLPEGGLDLRFDSGNAQAIFKMTSQGGV